MQTTILVLHILVCVVLIILILLQSGRDGMGVIFGGGGNSSVFGSQGAGGILSKLTAFLAALFIITSLGYNIMFSSNSSNNKSVLDVQFENVSTDTTPTIPIAPVIDSDSSATTDSNNVAESQKTPADTNNVAAETTDTKANDTTVTDEATTNNTTNFESTPSN